MATTCNEKHFVANLCKYQIGNVLKMSFIMYLSVILLVSFVLESVASISNKNASSDFTQALLDLSNIAIQGRQNQPYYQENYLNVPKYSQFYRPEKVQYGYPQNYPSNYLSNEIYNQHRPSPYPYYLNGVPQPKPPFFQKTQESVMEALFSIAQNDDLQCVPKLLCEITAGSLTGRQAGFGLPVNVNLQSLTAFLSGLNSANMSPVLHFGKAALLGYASKGNSRSCQYSYPQCPSDPDRLIQYLNNHNGGFFRFFQGISPPGHQNLQNYAPQYLNGYRPEYFGKGLAEKRIQNQPSTFINSNFDRDNYYKEHRGLSFPQSSYTTQNYNAAAGPRKVIFPNNQEQPNTYFGTSGVQSLKFPSEYDNNAPVRQGKVLHFDPYLSQSNDNFLDIQRPLPNHVPAKNIFPDRTGTGELKLDFEDLEQNYQQSVAYDYGHYNQLLYDSFPNEGGSRIKPSYLSFPH